MAQRNFSVMISVDWLTVNLYSPECINTAPGGECFVWKPRQYGSKQWKMIYDISWVDNDAVMQPFGVLCACPTSQCWEQTLCSLKLDNHLLYQDGRQLWFDLLTKFLNEYKLFLRNIARVDMAADFLYLRDRLSGAQLAQRIKSLHYWKCGSVNISEHYTLPYSVKYDSDRTDSEQETNIYLQNGRLLPRVETLTFGTMSSEAQVCLYDKTLELNRSQVTIKVDGKEHKESVKEYIRDCHKNANVFSEKRHTWRLEIRLKNGSCFLNTDQSGKRVPLSLDDLKPAALPLTFLAAQRKYFRLVDATDGGKNVLNSEWVASMRTHKNRLPEVNLFTDAALTVQFCKRPSHVPANKFNRDVINRLDQLGERLKRCPEPVSLPNDNETLDAALELLPKIQARCTVARKVDEHLVKALSDYIEESKTKGVLASPEELAVLQRAKEVAERHFHTESPGFVKNMIAMLKKAADKMRTMIDTSATTLRHAFRCAKVSDSQVLLDAAEILKAVFVDVAFDERKSCNASIYEAKLRDNIDFFNQTVHPDSDMLDSIYTYMMSNRFVPLDRIKSVLVDYAYTPFLQLVRMNWASDTFNAHFAPRQDLSEWRPPFLGRFEDRKSLTPLLNTISTNNNL